MSLMSVADGAGGSDKGDILRGGRRFLDRLDRRGEPDVVVGWWFGFGA